MRSDEEVLEQIKHILETNVAPLWQDMVVLIDFVSYEDGHLV